MACFVATGDVVVNGNAIFTGDGTFDSINVVTGVNLPGGGSVLDYHENKTTVPVTYTGALSGSIDLIASRIGSICVLHIPQFSGASLGNLDIVISGLPAKFTPSLDLISFEYLAIDNSLISPGDLVIDNTTGEITLYATTSQASFAAAGNCGINNSIDLCYIV